MTQALVEIAYRGSVYALLAFGFALTYGVTGAFNLAYPIAAVTGALVAARLLATGHPLAPAVVAGVAAGAVAGIIVERIALWPARLRRAGALGANAPLAAGAALAMLFALAPSGWLRGLAFVGGIAPLLGTLRVGGVAIPKGEALGVLTCVAALCAGWLLIRRTRFGLGIRAVASNPAAAAAVGVSAEMVIVQTVAIASALGAVAGITLQLVSAEALPPERLVGVVLAVFASVVLGGLGSPGGCVVAAYAVVAVQIIIDSHFATRFVPDDGPAVFAAIVLLGLALFPAGLLRRRALRAEKPA